MKLWSLRLSVRTPGFQPGKRGSIPLGTTILKPLFYNDNHLKKLSVTPSVTPYFLRFSEDFISLGKFPCVQVLKKSVIFSFL